MKRMFQDALAKPQLFSWTGPPDSEGLEDLLERLDCLVPDDLIKFWSTCGGGLAFETETFLQPVPVDPDEGVEHVTQWHRGRGMESGLVVFHEGLGTSAVRCGDGAFVVLAPDESVIQEYPGFDEWYVGFLRSEYASRYGLHR